MNTPTTTQTAQQAETDFTPIAGTLADGTRVWYTGRAGAGWVSQNPKDAFLGYSLDGARNRARKFNEMTPLHGIVFVAVAGSLADDVRLAQETL